MSQVTTEMCSPPLRILSLGKPPEPKSLRLLTSSDGGGIRGLSSLLILENIMEHLRLEKGLNQVPRPCDYFDLIGGTSTGGYVS